ncbi:solute carrier family 22 member 6-A-like [Ctenocephalides felis]|uniref:solute carrier family 22 member 6-A-like n=1 Tax=Ctenocephalides felis TaxID=7515 RepID=UPI000E6E4E4C|nr:solute carrier family 22 member 6-A-like [Ctenocephalides felis]
MKNSDLNGTRQRVRAIVETTGRYQVILCILLSIHSAIVAFNHTEPAFLNYEPAFRCKDNGTIKEYIGCASLQNGTCHTGFEFAEDERTIITDFSLVCSRRYLAALATVLYFGGVTIGALVFGPLADRLGRRKVTLICLYTQAALGILQGLLGSYGGFVIFAALRMLQGAFVQGLQSSTFTLLLELFPVRHRTAVAVIWEIFWAGGCAFMASVAWILADWRYLQIVLALPAIVSVIYSWNIPESALWLTTIGKYRSAHQVCDRIMRFNGTKQDMNRNGTTCQSEQLVENVVSDPVIEKIGLIGIFKNSLLRKHALVMTMVWFSVTLCYYGTVFYLPKLDGQRHVNFLIGAFIEVVAYLLAFWALSKFGRRWPTALYQILCGAICATVAGITFYTGHHQGMLIIGLILAGKGIAVSCFCCMFLYTSELFPTSVRGAALGLCGFWSRIGGLLSPLLLVLGEITDRSVPLMCLGALALVTGFISLALPDTNNTTLPDTIAEAQTAYNKSYPKSQENTHV